MAVYFIFYVYVYLFGVALCAYINMQIQCDDDACLQP